MSPIVRCGIVGHMHGLRSWIVLFLALTSGAVDLPAGATQLDAADTPFERPRAPAWPGGGGSTTRALERLTLEQTAADRLRRFPESPHTVAWLSHAKRTGRCPQRPGRHRRSASRTHG